MTSAAAGFGEPPPPPPHVAQRSRRDKLRFPATADMMLSAYDDAPTTGDAYAGRASATDLGYLHAVVAPPLAAPADPWRAAQCDASAPWAAPAACAKPEHGGSGSGRFASQAALSLTLSPALQELPASYGGSLQSVVGAAVAAGPLGPFTGYAAVLKGSRFLRPAQQLLDEFCAAVVGVESSTADISAGASPSSLNSSSSEAGGGGDMQCQRPEFREKKAKLLYMQDEVCKRYKQYHQQVQMVVSLFESVPGLSSATPYASSALKSISKHFRHLRSLISTQIQQISRLLGEEFLSLPSSSGGSGKASTPRLGFVEQGQPVWRPQRGLPERAVAVLRAWLFDHFLHPYPTDADKHMLATQTGLSRNQVSNWFINARVRLWKPMVEEIHMLETRATANPNAPSNSVGSRHLNPAASSTARPPLPPQQLPPPECGHPMMEQCCVSALQDDGCAPMDHQPVPHCGGMQGGGHVMMSFGAGPPYAGGMHVGGGFGAVSLTLGLRRDVSYPQQQFGGQMLRDLVG